MTEIVFIIYLNSDDSSRTDLVDSAAAKYGAAQTEIAALKAEQQRFGGAAGNAPQCAGTAGAAKHADQ